MNDAKKNNRRYYLHRKIREQGFRLNTKSRTILVQANKPDSLSKQVERLKSEFGYCEQLTL